jgi:hypothetical protein
MKALMLATILAVSFLAALFAFAATCSSQADCRPGEQCSKPQGWLTGLCTIGGVPRPDQPGSRQNTSILPRSTYGNPCRSNADCGLNAVCAPSAPGSSTGACLPER